MQFDEYERTSSTGTASRSSSSSSSSSSNSFEIGKVCVTTPITQTNNMQQSSMSSSSSQIFATAAAFNISQNDTVYYTRETIHLLAKFLSNGDMLFRSLYAYAPDNLAWLWSFIDWDTPIDFAALVPTQETYTPFSCVENGTRLEPAQLELINKMFIDAPLLQYKYREPIMIADVYKFIEHVHKIEAAPVARALFSLYFPRLASHLAEDSKNSLSNLMSVRVLKANIGVVKRVDEIIVSLIKSRYSNIGEYKQKIESGRALPSYIRSLIKENTGRNLFSLRIANTTSPLCGIDESVELVKLVPSRDETLTYMKLLEKHNKTLNEDLDQHQNESEPFFAQNTGKVTNILSSQEQDFSIQQIQNLLTTTDTNATMDSVFISEKEQQDSNNNLASKYLDLIYKTVVEAAAAAVVPTPQQQQQQQNLNETSIYFNNNNEHQYQQQQKQQLDFCGSFDEQPSQRTLSYNNNNNNTNNTPFKSRCMSPISMPLSPSKSNNKNTNSSCSSSSLLYTPKTPNSNFIQHENINNSSSVSAWPETMNFSNNNKLSLSINSNCNNNRAYMSSTSSVTPPPSATIRTTPLSVITNELFNPALMSPTSSSSSSSTSAPCFNAKNANKTLNDSLNLNQQYQQQQEVDSLNAYLKHQFYGSPLNTPRLNKLNENKRLVKNGNDLSTYSTYSSFKNQQQQQLQRSSYDMEIGLANLSLLVNNANSNNISLFDDILLNSPVSNSSSSSSSTANNKQQQSYMQFQQHQQQQQMQMQQSHQQHTWCGRLPPKIYSENTIYSRKVFLGGLPWDVNQSHLMQLLQKYGSVKIEIPGKDAKHPRVSSMCKTQERSTPGYVYIIYEHESAVQKMLADCRKEIKNGGEHYFYTIFIPNINSPGGNGGNSYFNNAVFNKRSGMNSGKAKEVEVIPWNQEDTSYVPQSKTTILPAKIDAKSTIFVGALHGMLNAQGLAKVMNEVFGEVIHAGLDTDKYKYPIGSGRVTFRNRQSYIKAIKAKYVSIKANLEATDPSPKFEKTIQIDPYLEDAKCFKCNQRSLYFCRNENCLDYYCEMCWRTNHDMIGNGEHQSLSRQTKPNTNNMCN